MKHSRPQNVGSQQETSQYHLAEPDSANFRTAECEHKLILQSPN